MIYNCFRCGYNTNHKGHFTNHLNRKKICKPILEDISIYEIKKHYNIVINSNSENTVQKPQNTTIQKCEMISNNFKIIENKTDKTESSKKKWCKYCNKFFTRRDSLNRHLKICKNKIEKDMELQENKDEFQEKTDEMKEIIDEMKNIVYENKNKINELENIIENLSYDLKECISLNKKLRKENRRLNDKNLDL